MFLQGVIHMEFYFNTLSKGMMLYASSDSLKLNDYEKRIFMLCNGH